MALSGSIHDREYRKFVESPSRPDQSAIEVTGTFASVTVEKSTLVDLVSSSVIYLGEAATGSASSSALWLIKKITISGSSISILCANGSANADQIWDNRGALTYV